MLALLLDANDRCSESRAAIMPAISNDSFPFGLDPTISQATAFAHDGELTLHIGGGAG